MKRILESARESDSVHLSTEPEDEVSRCGLTTLFFQQKYQNF